MQLLRLNGDIGVDFDWPHDSMGISHMPKHTNHTHQTW